ncbi:MAG: DUF2752 domain-containing protein [Spirulinaceae cyanobacterium]
MENLLSKRLKVALLCGAITTAIVLLYNFDPAAPDTFFPASPFRSLTNLYCPGCGTTRGLHQILHGNILAALDLNPLMVLFLPYLIYAFCAYSAPVITSYRLPQPYVKGKWIWGLLVIVLAYWVLRNLPMWPFSWLAP